MTSEDVAAEALERLGLTEYESRCFIALTRLPQGTAKEISQIANIPRSRVYDTVDRLHRQGLVDVQQSDPRVYRAVSKDDAFAKLRQDYDSAIEAADEALDQVESAETQEEKGVWAVANADHVSSRVTALIDDAEDQIHLIIADETTLNQDSLNRLAAASDRGVRVVVEVPSESVRNDVRQTVPDAAIEVTETLQETQKVVRKWPGQLILVDQQAVLASGVEDGELPGIEDETAMWSHGRDHGFAAWMPELLEDRINAGSTD